MNNDPNLTSVEYTDIKGVVAKVDDILKYDEGEGYSKCIHKIVMHEGLMAGQIIVGCPEWTIIDNDAPVELEHFCHTYGTQFIDAEIVGNVNDNPEMMTTEYAEKVFPDE